MKSPVTIFLFLFLFTSCLKNTNDITIGFLFHNFDVPRWEREKDIFEKRIKELGGKVVVKSANGNDFLQRNQALELLEQGVDLLVVIPVNAASAEIVRMAHDEGVKVMSYAGMIPNCELDYHIEFDSERCGQLQAEYLLRKKENSKFVLINTGNSESPFYRGAMDILKPKVENGSVEIVYSTFIQNWSATDAAFHAEKAVEFSNTKIDAFLAVNDGMAGAIIEVLKKRALLNETEITGMDAEISACKRIIDEEQGMTVYKPSRLIANEAAEMAFNIIKKKKIEGLREVSNGRILVPTKYIEPIVVDKSNIESTVVADGIYTMDEIEGYSD